MRQRPLGCPESQIRILTLIILLGVPTFLRAQPEPPRHLQVAEGVHLFITPPYGDFGFDGNSVVIVSNEGVLVFDTNGTEAAAEAVLAEIRKLTDKPVRYVVNSHWHWDHWYGTEVYRRAFPGIRVISHEKTRELMMGPALEFNRPGLEQQLPGYLDALARAQSEAEAAAPPPPNLKELRAAVATGRFFLDQKKRATHVFPDVTFSDRLTLHLGEREIQIINYGRAVTPGDAFLYLPKEGIVVTGDLLVNPVSFALGVYPTEWLEALERIDGLMAKILIPGHGERLRDKVLLHATMDLFRELLAYGKEARTRGLKPAEAIAAVLPRLRDLRARIAGDDLRSNQQFDLYLVSWYLHRVYDELAGPLTDAIAPAPAGG